MDLTFCQFSQVDILKSGNVVPNSVFFFFFFFPFSFFLIRITWRLAFVYNAFIHLGDKKHYKIKSFFETLIFLFL